MSEVNVVLETGVPIPTKTLPKRKPKYPFDDMKVDTSFFVAGASANTMHAAIGRYKATDEGKDKEFTIRSLEEVVKGEKNDLPQIGVRVWRTK